jgi:hypothetical protein
MRTRSRPFTLTPRGRWRVAAVLCLGAGATGCVENEGLMVILGNQIPTMDATTHTCSAMMGGALLGQGRLDLGVGTPQAYVAYPVVQNRLPARGTAGGFEPNRVMLDGFRVTLKAPPGYDFPWSADVPNHVEPHFPQGLEPSTSLTGTVEIVSQTQAKAILDEFRPGGLNPDLAQQIIFTAEIRAVGQLNGGEIESDVFRFPIRMCVGCMQTGFTDVAQYNYPGLPLCTIAPRPNLHKGNDCHFAQDEGLLLCCLDESQHPVCPSPDQ